MTYQLPESWTPEEIAERLKLNPEWVRDQINAGRIGCLRASRRSVSLLPRHVEELIALTEKPATSVDRPTTSAFGATSRSTARRRSMAQAATTASK